MFDFGNLQNVNLPKQSGQGNSLESLFNNPANKQSPWGGGVGTFGDPSKFAFNNGYTIQKDWRPELDPLGKFGHSAFAGMNGMSSGPMGEQAQTVQNTPNSYLVYKDTDLATARDKGAARLNGTNYDVYDLQGNHKLTDQFRDLSSASAMQQFFSALAMATPAAAGFMMAPAAAGAGGAAGGGWMAGAEAAGAMGSPLGAGGVAGAMGSTASPIFLSGGAPAGFAGAGAAAAAGAGSGGGSLLSGLGSTLGKGAAGLASLFRGGGGGGDLGGLGALIPGTLDAVQQGKASQEMLQWLRGNQQKVEDYFKPDSPEWKHMWEAMSRKDAAGGRNSQYGPRTAEFLAKVAEARADALTRFTTGTHSANSGAINQGANKYSGLMGALGNGTGLGSLFNRFTNGSSLVNDMSWMPQTSGLSINSGLSNDDIMDIINGNSVEVDISDWWN